MFLIYVYSPSGDNLTQIFNAYNISINLKLNDISSASFYIPTNENCKYEYFKEFNKYKIFSVVDGEEKLMFSGILRAGEPGLHKTKITLNDYHFLLRKKALYVQKVYNNQAINSIIQDLLNHINSRNPGFIQSVVCDVVELVNKDYSEKKNFFDILKDLAGDKYEFLFDGETLIFQETIGKNRATGGNIVYFEYDIFSGGSRNIIDANFSYDSDNIVNAVLGNDGNVEDTESIVEFGRIEESFTSGIASEILEERKTSTKELSIDTILTDFFVCNIGDLVKVYINTNNDIMNFNGALKVIEKNFTSGGINKITLKLNTGKVKSLNVKEFLQDLNTRVRNLEL